MKESMEVFQNKTQNTGTVPLSPRLQAVAGLLSGGAWHTLCDIGCDHGYLSVYLLQTGLAQRMLAMDVNEGPLGRAKESGALWHVEEKLECRISDGLKALAAGEAEGFVCAGMGGRLISRILTDSPQVLKQMKIAVLQPQSDLELVRQTVYALGWHIVAEDVAFEADGGTHKVGKYYPMFSIAPGRANEPAREVLCYGAAALQRHPHMWRQYLQHLLGGTEYALTQIKQQGMGENARVRQQTLKLQQKQLCRLLTKAD